MTEEEKQQLEYQQVREMTTTDGWKVIERDFIEKARELTSDLLEAQDISEVQRLQAAIKSYNAFFEIVLEKYKGEG